MLFLPGNIGNPQGKEHQNEPNQANKGFVTALAISITAQISVLKGKRKAAMSIV
jgi:hypothetical protein